MSFSFEFVVDPANKLLIYEAYGEVTEVIKLEHMLKSIVKVAGKNQIKNIVLDGTQLKILCSNVDIVKMMITIQEHGLLHGLKIARIVKLDLNVQNVIEGLAEKLSLSIKNFETRSEAMLWLLFNKERENH